MGACTKIGGLPRASMITNACPSSAACCRRCLPCLRGGRAPRRRGCSCASRLIVDCSSARRKAQSRAVGQAVAVASAATLAVAEAGVGVVEGLASWAGSMKMWVGSALGELMVVRGLLGSVRGIGVVAAVVVASACLVVGAARAGTTSVVSIPPSGPLNEAWSFWPSVSGNGRFVAFNSENPQLVPGDTNGVSDVFVFDRETGAYDRVSVRTGGQQFAAGSRSPAISADGRYVVFVSTEQVGQVSAMSAQGRIYVRDRSLGTLIAATVGVDGDAPNSSSDWPDISDDGRYVVFNSAATNLVPERSEPSPRAYLFDTFAQTTSIAVRETNGVPAPVNDGVTISGDGRFVGFTSSSPRIVPGDSGTEVHAYVWNRITETAEKVDVANGIEGDGNVASAPSLSDNGNLVAFSSLARNLAQDENCFDMAETAPMCSCAIVRRTRRRWRPPRRSRQRQISRSNSLFAPCGSPNSAATGRSCSFVGSMTRRSFAVISAPAQSLSRASRRAAPPGASPRNPISYQRSPTSLMMVR